MLVESFSRTRWLDKLRPAGVSSIYHLSRRQHPQTRVSIPRLLTLDTFDSSSSQFRISSPAQVPALDPCPGFQPLQLSLHSYSYLLHLFLHMFLIPTVSALPGRSSGGEHGLGVLRLEPGRTRPEQSGNVFPSFIEHRLSTRSCTCSSLPAASRSYK